MGRLCGAAAVTTGKKGTSTAQPLRRDLYNYLQDSVQLNVSRSLSKELGSNPHRFY
jgi:hypothetical protein